MTDRTCTVEGCDKPVLCRGICQPHYQRLRRSGSLPLLPKPETWHSLSDVDKDAKTAVCSHCGPVGIRIRGGGRGPECATKRWKGKPSAQSKERLKAYNKRYWRRLKYGLTENQVAAFVEQARGRCLICDVAFGDDFHVDHCHDTGLVRGLLCKRCNFGLGWFEDDPARLLSAYVYLTASGKQASA